MEGKVCLVSNSSKGFSDPSDKIWFWMRIGWPLIASWLCVWLDDFAGLFLKTWFWFSIGFPLLACWICKELKGFSGTFFKILFLAKRWRLDVGLSCVGFNPRKTDTAGPFVFRTLKHSGLSLRNSATKMRRILFNLVTVGSSRVSPLSPILCQTSGNGTGIKCRTGTPKKI